jgi:hypothetical protein
VIKRLFGEHISSRHVRTQNRELSFRCIAYNLHRLINLLVIVTMVSTEPPDSYSLNTLSNEIYELYNTVISRITFVATLSLILSFIVTPQTLFMAAASAQSTTTTSTENTTGSAAATQQSISILDPGEINLEILRNSIISTLREPSTALAIKMAQLSSFNKTENINLETIRNNIISTLREPSTALAIKMAQLSSFNKTENITTLASIWGFPLVTIERYVSATRTDS